MTTNWFFGDNVDTDLIIPGEYLTINDPKELAKYCFIGINEEYARNIKPGDILIAGENFGCGSSREHAPLAIKSLGVKCIIAKSFARIFFRNAINIGLPVLESPETVYDINSTDELDIDLSNGVINNKTKNKVYSFTKYPPLLLKIVELGGVIKFMGMNK